MDVRLNFRVTSPGFAGKGIETRPHHGARDRLVSHRFSSYHFRLPHWEAPKVKPKRKVGGEIGGFFVVSGSVPIQRPLMTRGRNAR